MTTPMSDAYLAFSEIHAVAFSAFATPHNHLDAKRFAEDVALVTAALRRLAELETS